MGPTEIPPVPTGRLFRRSLSPATTLHEERREVFESVLQSLRIREPDADRVAACFYLLRHLARTEPPCRSAKAGVL